jgi:hypothetical protein
LHSDQDMDHLLGALATLWDELGLTTRIPAVAAE